MTKPQQFSGACSTGVAAKRLGVSLRTVQLWCMSGALSCYTTHGGHRRIYESDVAQMLKARRTVDVAHENANIVDEAEITPQVVHTSGSLLLLAARLQGSLDRGNLDKEDPQRYVKLAVYALRHFGAVLKEKEIRDEEDSRLRNSVLTEVTK